MIIKLHDVNSNVNSAVLKDTNFPNDADLKNLEVCSSKHFCGDKNEWSCASLAV